MGHGFVLHFVHANVRARVGSLLIESVFERGLDPQSIPRIESTPGVLDGVSITIHPWTLDDSWPGYKLPQKYGPFMNPLFWFVNFAIRVFTRIACRIDPPDWHQKVPMEGPLLIISNHTGELEVPLVYAHLQPRKVTGWAKVEAWDNWFLHWIFNIWGIIPVRRGEADMNALKLALRALEKGYILGVAPEGTRNRTGRLQRALPGTVILAMRSGAPVLPVAHWGGENFPSNFKHFKRTDFHIRVGEPFKVQVDGTKVTAEVRQEIMDEMMYKLAALLPEPYRGEYSDLGKSTCRFLKST